MASLQPRDVAYAGLGTVTISAAHAAAHNTFGEANALAEAAVGKAGLAVTATSFAVLLVGVRGR